MNQQVTVGHSSSYSIPTDIFEDPEDQTIAVQASLSNDGPLPSFTSFDDSTLTFVFYSTDNADANTYNIKLTGTDGLNEVSSTFEMIVTANQAP